MRKFGPSQVVLLAIIALCVAVELCLTLSDMEIIGNGRLRETAYEFGGFWPGLLRNWDANYDGQSIAMFVTYAFLHGGLVHLVFNMLTLWSLGNAVATLCGIWGLLAIYALSVIGGAIAYGALSTGFLPMVGASGALFGLAGALVALDYEARLRNRSSLLPVIQMVALLFAINIVMYWALDGQLAWQTHLGGALAGWASARAIGRKRQYQA